jgi:hypothetical protein
MLRKRSSAKESEEILMNINIQEIVDNKIQELNNSGTIQAAIEATLEKTVIGAITSALSDYSLRNKIEKQVTEQVSEVVKDIGFTAYNTFIANKVKQITEEVCRADIAEKVQQALDDMLLKRREEIKLSEIFELYRKELCEDVEEQDKWDRGYFHVKFERNERYGWYDIELAEEPQRSGYSKYSRDIHRFTLHQIPDRSGYGYISTVYLEGQSFKDKFRFGRLSDIEGLLSNLAYNKTPVLIDIEDEDDIDNSFDIDC